MNKKIRLSFLLLIGFLGIVFSINETILYNSANVVNVRNEPTTDSKILGHLSINDSIIPVDSINEWYKFDYQGKVAYVVKSFFSKEKTQTQKYWYNSKSGVLHNSGCRWFGNTENGYFTEDELGRDCKICGGAYRIQKNIVKSGNGKTYWINSNSGVRHNSRCRWFGITKEGYYTDEKEGRACKICGG